jgi:hypothetical protein
MGWDRARSVAEVKTALRMFDDSRAAELVREFVAYVCGTGDPYPEDEAHSLLTSLRRKRQFDLLCAAADALLQSGHGTLRIRQDYAQALLDLGLLSAAQAVLDALVRDSAQAAATESSVEARGEAERVHTEARGLIGRLYKQAYVNAGAPHVERNAITLGRAVDAYYSTYSERSGAPERRWHGVNAVALGLRAQADKPDTRLGFDPKQVAARLIAAVQADADAGTAKFWDYASAMEASLALDDEQAALRFLQSYIADPNLDAFEVASTLRQLVEVWSFLPPNSPRDRLFGPLQARLLGLNGGHVVIDAAEAGIDARRKAGMRHVFQPGFERADRYYLGLERALSIARIERDAWLGAGTGVLVRGGDLYAPLGDERLLLTNAHVASRAPANWEYAVDAAQARVTFLFGRTPGQEPYRTKVRDVVWESSPSTFDACLLRLDELPEHLAPCPIAAPARISELIEQSVYLAGYPFGASLQFSFIDNVVIDGDERVLYYRAETDKGSSGSPVFDRYFRLIALHHEGKVRRARLSHSGSCEACEGVRISAIAAALAQELGNR